MAAPSSSSNRSEVNIEQVIEKLSTNGTEELDKSYVKQLKLYCKSLDPSHDDAYNYLGRLVLHQLEKKHAQIRYGSLLIIEYLFERSHQFRLFICEHLNAFFELSVGIKGFKYVGTTEEDFDANSNGSNDKKPRSTNKKQLLPIEWARKLHTKAIQCFTYWYNEFGKGYQVLPSGYRFLQKHGAIACPVNNQITASTSSQRRNISDQSAIQQTQYEKIVKEFEDIESDANVLVTQVDTCFDLLIPKFKVMDEDDTNASDSIRFRPMQGLSFSIILNAKVEITRDSSNSDLLDNLKELCGELNQFYKSKLSQFYTTVGNLKLSLYETNMAELLNKIKCLKMKIATIVWKFNEINIVSSNSSTSDRLTNQPSSSQNVQKENDESDEETDDDDFEEVSYQEDLCLMKKIQIVKEKQRAETEQLETSQEPLSDIVDHKCRALLPSGKLCPRRDKVRCPFHGLILPRDHEGLPLDPDLRQKEIDARFQQKADEWKDPKYLKQISLETGHDLEGKNVKNKRKKYPNLIDIKKLENTPRKRLMQKIGSKRMREKVSSDLTAIDEQVHQQYSQQWSYALEN